MDNEWGTRYVQPSCSKGAYSINAFDLDIRGTVRGYTLCKVTESGTDANLHAICEVTGYQLECCLFGVGSYVGGLKHLQRFSTSTFANNGCLALPDYPENCTAGAQNQVISLPYHVPCPSLEPDKLKELENKCLEGIHMRLLMSAMYAKPIKCILLEYILGGCGGELSKPFLKKLGILCHHMNVKIIADEVLTTGRVGPHMTMTTTMPDELQKVVAYITCGKIINCGLVLKRVENRPTEMDLDERGLSTNLDCSEACFLWRVIAEHLDAGGIPDRQLAVLKIMGLDPGDWWGRGCLMFSTIKRPGVYKGLNNRLLPMICSFVKLVKGRCESSEWTPGTVNKHLKMMVELWLQHMIRVELRTNPWGFTFWRFVAMEGAHKYDLYKCDAKVILSWNLPFLTESYLEFESQKGSKKTATSCVQECLKVARDCPHFPFVRNVNGTAHRAVYVKREGAARDVVTHVECGLLGFKIVYDDQVNCGQD